MALKCDCSQDADTSELGEEFTETINTCTDRCRTKLFALQAETDRLRAELPPATCTAAFDFAQNVRRKKDGTFVSQAHLGQG